MKLVPKPDGYELRSRRADKQESCERWEPRDALYEAQQVMDGKDVRACVVIWQEVDETGKRSTKARRAGPADATKLITLDQLAYYMGWTGG